MSTDEVMFDLANFLNDCECKTEKERKECKKRFKCIANNWTHDPKKLNAKEGY